MGYELVAYSLVFDTVGGNGEEDCCYCLYIFIIL